MVLIASLLQGCIILGHQKIYAPDSTNATPVKYYYPHSGPASKAPPDAIMYQVPGTDTSTVFIKAAPLITKPQWFGAALPMFPLPFLKRKQYKHKLHPYTISIHVVVFSDKTVKIQTDSLLLTIGDRVVRPSHLIFKKKVYSPDTLLSVWK